MACEKCGYKNPPNPIGPLVALVGNSALLLFLSHVIPAPGSTDLFVNWHWLFWWFTAVCIPINVAFFFINVGRRVGK